jgi:Lar family restriction alleviation protein
MSDRSLLPCPFCGGEPRFGTGASEGIEGGHFIECGNCQASTSLVFPLKDDVTRELAERWNRRALSAGDKS